MNKSLPSSWVESELGDVLSHIIDFRGRTPKKLDMDWGGGDIPALSANNVQMGKVDFSKECYLASESLYERWMTKGDTQKNDILFTMEAPLGNVALVPDERKYILSQRVILLKTDAKKVDNKFLYQQLRSDSFQRQLKENSTGSTALGIQQKRLVQLSAILPPLPEQQKVAAILTSVDEVIETTQAQINKLKDLKTGMMQELLTNGIGHTEFKDSPVGRIPKAWEVKKLAELVKPNRPITYGIVQTGEHIENGIPCVRVVDLMKECLTTTNMIKTSLEISSQFKRTVLECGDIMFALRGEIGQVRIVSENLVGANLTRGVALISPVDSILKDYLLWAIRSGGVRQNILERVNGSALQEIPLGNLREVDIPIPQKSEQEKIVNALNSIENRLNTAHSKLSSQQKLKKALMQDLLTGKIRVKVSS